MVTTDGYPNVYIYTCICIIQTRVDVRPGRRPGLDHRPAGCTRPRATTLLCPLARATPARASRGRWGRSRLAVVYHCRGHRLVPPIFRARSCTAASVGIHTQRSGRRDCDGNGYPPDPRSTLPALCWFLCRGLRLAKQFKQSNHRVLVQRLCTTSSAAIECE